MARSVQVRKVRAELDGATAALVIADDAVRFVRLRVEQAMRRAGLDDLLKPAIAELDLICQSHSTAKSQVNAAIDKLME